MGLTPDLLLLALSSVLCGERMKEGLFICLVHPQYPQTLMEFQPAPFWSHALLFIILAPSPQIHLQTRP